MRIQMLRRVKATAPMRMYSTVLMIGRLTCCRTAHHLTDVILAKAILRNVEELVGPAQACTLVVRVKGVIA
jgi:hypothetical protein